MLGYQGSRDSRSRHDVNELLNHLCKQFYGMSCSKEPIRLNESITNVDDNSSLYHRSLPFYSLWSLPMSPGQFCLSRRWSRTGEWKYVDNTLKPTSEESQNIITRLLSRHPRSQLSSPIKCEMTEKLNSQW